MKPPALLDVDVLLALLWSHHADHDRVVRWHEQWMPDKWAVCPFTESGFLRTSLNPAFFAGQVPAEMLLETLRLLRSKRGCQRLDSMPDPADTRLRPLWQKVRSHHQVTDAFLPGAAMVADIHLVTMDRGISALADRPRARHPDSLNPSNITSTSSPRHHRKFSCAALAQWHI